MSQPSIQGFFLIFSHTMKVFKSQSSANFSGQITYSNKRLAELSIAEAICILSTPLPSLFRYHLYPVIISTLLPSLLRSHLYFVTISTPRHSLNCRHAESHLVPQLKIPSSRLGAVLKSSRTLQRPDLARNDRKIQHDNGRAKPPTGFKCDGRDHNGQELPAA